jgi:hypothetical protein
LFDGKWSQIVAYLVPKIESGSEERSFLQGCIKLLFQITLYFFGKVISQEPQKEALSELGWYVLLRFQQSTIYRMRILF